MEDTTDDLDNLLVEVRKTIYDNKIFLEKLASEAIEVDTETDSETETMEEDFEEL